MTGRTSAEAAASVISAALGQRIDAAIIMIVVVVVAYLALVELAKRQLVRRMRISG